MTLRSIISGPAFAPAVVLLTLAAQPLSAAAHRVAPSLSFEQRVAAQEAIERVYYSHQIEATRPFEEAVPREVLEKKVRTYLEQSAALETFWRTPITAAALRAELARIAARSRFPDRLEAIYHALGDDPVLVQECLARPLLVDRMARSFFASDERIHGERRAEAEVLRERLAGGAPSPEVAVGEEPDRFVIRAVESETADPARIATHEVRKTSWEEWWAANRGGLRWQEVASAAEVKEGLPLPRPAAALFPPARDAEGLEAGLTSCLPDDTWDNASLGLPVRLSGGHTIVWTGNVMVVWGGAIGGSTLNSGGRYDPLTDTWTATSVVGAPSPRVNHSAVWTGDRMIVWGDTDWDNTGGRYDPVADVWTAMSTVGAPTHAPAAHRDVVWTGTVMIVWSGLAPPTGGRYDPLADTWAPLSGVDAPLITEGGRAVWTGTAMIVFGRNNSTQQGGRYDPVTDTWAAIALVGAPSARSYHSAVWAGTSMIVWGGVDPGGNHLNTGGRYDPVANSWTPTAMSNAPTARRRHTAVWTGDAMLIWGGRIDYPYVVQGGGRYDPLTDTWTSISTLNAPGSAPAVWTGSLMLTCGENLRGGRYDPADDLWTPIASPGPVPLSYAAATWTGTLMVIWGGIDQDNNRTNRGDRYDPLLDAWTPVSTLGAPSAREPRTALWTGSRMLIWGGYQGGNTGGRYDPITDSWSPTSIVGAPPAPSKGHVAVWTGQRMLVWGKASDLLAHGGRYDPATDIWQPISEVNAPVFAEYGETAVWTGTKMVVWSGGGSTDGRYDPASDTWSPVSMVNAPSERFGHEAVWTGSRMVVWGGSGAETVWYLYTGGRYDPVADVWQPTSTTNTPEGRAGHTLVWSGTRMIVWGGSTNPYPPFDSANTGGRYDPVADSWEHTSTSAAPSPRDGHTAVWTGTHMIVAGGSYVGTMGGQYTWGQAQDLDGDGFSPCTGDCDDASVAIHPGGAEICDGRDTNCDGILPPSEYDSDGDSVAACGDCDDADPLRYPGNHEVCDGIDHDCNGVPDEPLPPEANNGVDEQCGGDPGFGLIDEISGTSGFSNLASPSTFSWPPQYGATLYEALRSNRPDFASGCDWTTTADPFWIDPTVPPAREALYYLVRPLLPSQGSLGRRSSGVERAGLCGAERICNDGVDDDVDGATDCADVTDCFGEGACTSVSMASVDTPGDDLASAAIQTFLSSVPASASNFIRVSITGPSNADFDLCLERADFYRAQYLALAPTDGIAVSGSWNKWHRTEGGGWIGPGTTGHDNWFGDSCVGAFSWCVEVGLGGHAPAFAPGETGLCEVFDDITCSDGSWTATIVIGVDRLSACGF